jgi:cobalt-precorrin-6B (C15)-methyltransferase
MSRVALPHDAKAGPIKAEVRAVLLAKLDSRPTDHVAEVGSCTGAVTIEAARRAGRVTALERERDRLETTEKNLTANQTNAAASEPNRTTCDGNSRGVREHIDRAARSASALPGSSPTIKVRLR